MTLPQIKLPSVVLRLLSLFFLLVISAVGIAFVYRGETDDGKILYQAGYDTSVGTPYESSNSTSRYVLTEAIVDNHSFALTTDQARVASPDLVKYKDTYMSIFTPGVSLLGAPLYMLGEKIGLPQLTTFLLNSIVAVLNVWLISKLARVLGASKTSGYISGLAFLFATNALVYSQTYTQHHITVFLLIVELLIANATMSASADITAGFFYGYGLLIDIPNAFLLMPPFLTTVWRHFEIHTVGAKSSLKLKLVGLVLLVGLLPSLLFFGYYNKSLTGSYTKLGQFIGRYDFPNPADTTRTETLTKEAEVAAAYKGPEPLRLYKAIFRTRDQLLSLQILLLSRQRSWIFYSPIVFVGVAGLYFAYRNAKTRKIATLILMVIIIDIVLYGSFDDPWGGWAFGPRYLIPAAALLCAAIGVTLEHARKKIYLLIPTTVVFFVLLFLSIQTNVLGTLTTAAIPSRGEAESLKNDTPWTTEYNRRIIFRDHRTTSLLYNMYWKDTLEPNKYLRDVTVGIFSLFVLTYGIWLWRKQ